MVLPLHIDINGLQNIYLVITIKAIIGIRYQVSGTGKHNYMVTKRIGLDLGTKVNCFHAIYMLYTPGNVIDG